MADTFETLQRDCSDCGLVLTELTSSATTISKFGIFPVLDGQGADGFSVNTLADVRAHLDSRKRERR